MFTTRRAVELKSLLSETVLGEGLGDETASRGDNSELAVIRQEVTLMSRPVSRPSNPRERGVRNSTVHQNPFEKWSAFCKKQHVRTTKAKGCHMAFTDPLRSSITKQ